MKKTLIMALGVILWSAAPWSAAPAPAASQMDFSGYYRSYFLNDWNKNRDRGRSKTHDNYFLDRLNLDFGFHPTDEVAFYWRLRAPNNQRWGADDQAAETYHAYGVVKRDWGTVSIGLLADSFAYAGLYSFGWIPGGVNDHFTEWGAFDYSLAYNGIRYAKGWDNGLGFVAQFYRMDSAHADRGEEQTHDWLILHPAYRWDGGGASLSVILQRDHVRGNLGPHSTSQKPGSPLNPALKAVYIGPAFAHSWGGLSFHFEGKAGWGKHHGLSKDVAHPLFPSLSPGVGDKNNGQAFYLDFDYNYGPGDVMLAGWWVSGTGRDSADGRSLFDMGPDFLPLIVAYDTTAKWYKSAARGAINDANTRSAASDWDRGKGNNHWAVALNGAHTFTDDLTLTYTLAHLALNKTAPGRGKSIGFEADLGLALKLLDNLEFRTTFGYLFAGPALDLPAQQAVGTQSAADSYAWYNTLTFSF